MTHDPWQPPTEPWAPDEAETQWVRSASAELVDPADVTAPTVPTAPAAGTEPFAHPDSQPPTGASAAAGAALAPAGATPADASASSTLAADPTSRSTESSDFRLLRLVAQIACPLLLVAGLTWDVDGTNGWESTSAWALFAVVCAVLQLAPLASRYVGLRLSTEHGWFFAALGSAGLAAYWLVIVLPDANGDAGFLLTLATWLAVVGAWLTPGRHRPIS